MWLTPLRAAVGCLALPLVYAATAPFENAVITRTFDLGGSTSLVTTVYNVKQLDAGATSYELALGGQDEEEPSWWEVVVGGKVVEGLEVVGGDGNS